MPETSNKTRVMIVGRGAIEAPAPTVMAHGMGDVKYTQVYVSEEASMPPVARKSSTNDLVKPPYRVPSMDEIAALPLNGFKAISTFSGCGGSSLGHRMAGFKVLWASEFVEAARDCYRANFPTTTLDDRDVRDVKADDVLEAIGMGPGELDLLDGSPPCASFSTAGKRSKHWGQVKKYSDREQRTDDLFFEYVRLVDGIRPKTFVAENVSGLVKGVAKGYFLEILAALKGCGYRVKVKVLDAQWLGVPQQRQRAIFVGVREDLVDASGAPLEPCHPTPLSYRYSVREAIPWIDGSIEQTLYYGDEKVRSRSTDGPSPSVKATGMGATAHGSVRVVEAGHGFMPGIDRTVEEPFPTVWSSPAQELRMVEPEADMTGKATGAAWDEMNGAGQSDRYFQLVRPDVANPCPTVTAAGGNAGLASVCHPTQRRKFSISELKRICAFPDDFILTGSYAQRWERLGRAVPPVMMAAIAAAVRDGVLMKIAAPKKKSPRR